MKMCFKFQQIRTINEQFDFLRGGEGGAKGPPLKKKILFINDKHIKMLFFKFQQNYTINEEFDF